MLNLTLIDRQEDPKPIQSSSMTFSEATCNICNHFRKVEIDKFIEIIAQNATCQVTIEGWNTSILVATYTISNDYNWASLPKYLLRSGELFFKKYNRHSEMNKLITQMKETLKVDDLTIIEYQVW